MMGSPYPLWLDLLLILGLFVLIFVFLATIVLAVYLLSGYGIDRRKR